MRSNAHPSLYPMAQKIILPILLMVFINFQPAYASSVVTNICISSRCHPDISSKRNLHGPVATRQCTPCHKLGKNYDPNRHNTESFDMTTDRKKLCLECHDDIKKKMTLKSTHKDMADMGCIICHDPHQSERKFHLKEINIARICLKCHKKLGNSIINSTYVHRPIKDGRCEGCHNPHPSGCPSFLKNCHNEEPDIWGGPPNSSYISSCWGCHQRETILDNRTLLTGFRNGDLNLHYLHVVEKRPRAGHPCKRCHQKHASNTPSLIRDDVSMDRGVWTYPVEYSQTIDGGSCVIECHRELGYGRENPFSY